MCRLMCRLMYLNKSNDVIMFCEGEEESNLLEIMCRLMCRNVDDLHADVLSFVC